METCPIHGYVLGSCPSCDVDPRPLLAYYEEWPARVTEVTAPVLANQRFRLPAIPYLKGALLKQCAWCGRLETHGLGYHGPKLPLRIGETHGMCPQCAESFHSKVR